MKTFEERYTAWIDNKLEGPALTSFELELSRRAAAGEARADKADAGRLHRLLAIHLRAPVMTNAEFFSHQLRERIDGERAAGRRREEARQARGSIFASSFFRMVGLSAAAVFVATALYYGMMPSHPLALPTSVASTKASATEVLSAAASEPAPAAVAAASPVRGSSGSEWAMAAPTPSFDLNSEIQVFRGPAATAAPPLNYKDPNVSVLWVNGLDYMPSLPADSPADTVPAPSVGP